MPYVMVDIESDGLIPDKYSMVPLGNTEAMLRMSEEMGLAMGGE